MIKKKSEEPEETVVPAEEVEDDVNTLNPDTADVDEFVEEDDQHPDNDDELDEEASNDVPE